MTASAEPTKMIQLNLTESEAAALSQLYVLGITVYNSDLVLGLKIVALLRSEWSASVLVETAERISDKLEKLCDAAFNKRTEHL